MPRQARLDARCGLPGRTGPVTGYGLPLGPGRRLGPGGRLARSGHARTARFPVFSVLSQEVPAPLASSTYEAKVTAQSNGPNPPR